MNTWWNGLREETRKILVQIGCAIPAATLAVVQVIGIVTRWWTEERPEYTVTSIPVQIVKNEKFLQQSAIRLAPFDAQTTLVLANSTSKPMTNVVVVLDRSGEYAVSNGKEFSELHSFDKRVSIQDLPPHAGIYYVFLWHKNVMEAGEHFILSSTEFGTQKNPFETETLMKGWYFWGFWLAIFTVLILLTLQIWQWWQHRKIARLAQPASPDTAS